MNKGTSHRTGRVIASLVAAMTLLGGLTTLPASAADDITDAGYHATAPSGLTRPATVPSLDGWTADAGAWTLGDGTRVVADAALKARADSLATELSAFSGKTIATATTGATDKDITLVLDTSKKTELGDEGFTLSVGKTGLTVTGATDIGVFYGTRSVSQMLRQGQLSLPAGSVTSKPKYAERGATLCACQINISTDWIDRFLADMADLRLNYVLMEMKLKPGEENTKKAETWSYYTRDDVKRFVAKAKTYGIDVIPEINSPGHMNIWLENYPEYQLENKDGVKDSNRLDITNPAAVQFYKTLIDEYDGVFDTDYWHMGADEYMIGSSFANYPKLQQFAVDQYGEGSTPNDAFTAFINDIDAYVRAKGKKLRIWNDGIVTTKNVTLNKDVIVEYWARGKGRTPSDLSSNGYQLMNASQSLYWSRSAKSLYTVNSRNLYNNANWNVGTFDGGQQIDKNYEGLRGAKVSIWPDRSDLETENEVEQEIFDGMRFISQMTWSDSRPWTNWDAMKTDIDKIGHSLDVRSYDYTPVEEGTYRIAGLDSVGKGPWALKTTPDGYYQMTDTATGKCLALAKGVGSGSLLKEHLNVVTQVGARPELVDCVDTDVTYRTDISDKTAPKRNQQKWQLRAVKDGTFTIAPALTQQRLAIATGTEKHIDLDLLKADTPDDYPTAGTLAQFPADLVGDNALFTLERQLGMTVSTSAATVTPASPVDITVNVNAPSTANTKAVTVTPSVPQGWKVLPSKVDLKAIPAGKTAKAVFRVVNTADAAEGAADVTFALTATGGDAAALATAKTTLAGSLTASVETSDYAADSAESVSEQTPAANAFDKNPNTFWHSSYSDASKNKMPHWLAFKASPGQNAKISEITHLYRQDKSGNNLNGPAKTVEVYVVGATGIDSVAKVTDWGTAVATASLPYSKELQTIKLPADKVPAGDVYVKFVITSGWGIAQEGAGVSWSAVAELDAKANVAAVQLVEPEQPKDNPSVTEPDPDPTPQPVDKTELKAAVAEAEAKLTDPNRFTNAADVAAAQTALRNAQNVLADESVDQNAVNDAADALKAAVGKLTEDTTKPTLKGVEDATIEQGTVFAPLEGVTATDNVEQDLSIIVSGKVDVNTPGTYTLTYTVTDKAGNTATATRTITVAAKAPVDPDKPAATKVTISGTDVKDGGLTVKVGATATLAASVEPKDADQHVTWSSSNAHVVAIDAATGKLTAKAEGKATITATTASGKTRAGAVSGTIEVTVVRDGGDQGGAGETGKQPGKEPGKQPGKQPNGGKLSNTGASTAAMIAAMGALAAAGVATAVTARRRRS